MSDPPRERLAVFARAPRLGEVKTRLCPPLKAEQALALHRALVEDTLENLGAALRPGLEHWLYLSEPLDSREDLSVPAGWEVRLQGKGSLGARLEAAFREALLAHGRDRLVVIGSDSPTIPVPFIDEAFDELGRNDAVIGPAQDGGYYLLGCSRLLPELFTDITWGSHRVLDETTAALTHAGRSFRLLPPWYDVDTEDNLVRLREEIEFLIRQSPSQAPRRIAEILPGMTSPWTAEREW